ncbi:protein TIFY 5A-like [Neltuma alba]|uniref:protein TIFY 5A-like n=1 Tax=Neltuma alba TaxID=207710 RepID=UPI0010A33D9F|nr:protein TIFY 5A-like [Prosopis alba]
MKRNCELELGLQPRTNRPGNSIDEPLDITEQHHPPQILHSGRHCFIDVTEFQARVIIWLASRGMEGSGTGAGTSSFWVQSQALMSGGGCVHGGGLSLKKSLHSFLQKRKKRLQQQQQTKSQCDDCE